MTLKARVLRVAHLSDMHCYRLSLNPLQFLSKRWLGNLNVLINRRLVFDPDPCDNLTALLKSLDLDHLLFAGDISTTALPEEFAIAKAFADNLRKEGIQFHIVPGNHDIYTRRADRQKLFYRYFEDKNDPSKLRLSQDKIAVRELGAHFWWVGLDTAIPTSLLSSKGHFSPTLEQKLYEALQSIPSSDKILLVNHFPLYPTVHPQHDMEGNRALRKVLKEFPNVKLYLHGHVHRQNITDARKKGLPIILNSGSCGFKRRATCHVIDLHESGCKIDVYGRSQEGGEKEPWGFLYEETFLW